jgi:hypothetical protein
VQPGTNLLKRAGSLAQNAQGVPRQLSLGISSRALANMSLLDGMRAVLGIARNAQNSALSAADSFDRKMTVCCLFVRKH